MSSASEFGKDMGLMHEVVITGRKAGFTSEDWGKLAHCEKTMSELLSVLRGLGKIVITKIIEIVHRGIEIPALLEKFEVAKHFIQDISEKAEVKISYLGGNFKSDFLNQVIEPHEARKLDAGKLTENSRDDRILAELGSDKCETTLDAVRVLLKKQSKGEDGVLLTNGYANIFYVRNVSGVLRAVSVFWHGDGWYVYSGSVGFPRVWYEGSLVFSRNS